MARRLPILVLVIASVLPAHAFALGCTCLDSAKRPKKAAREADAVFMGVADQVIFVMDGRPVGPEVDRLSEFVRMIVIFRVTKAWKGVRETRIAITTGPDPDVECGFPFEKDGLYVVYADQVKYARGGREGWELSTSRCHRTRGGPAALSEARALGKPDWAPAP
jgi:hypothetical protein